MSTQKPTSAIMNSSMMNRVPLISGSSADPGGADDSVAEELCVTSSMLFSLQSARESSIFGVDRPNHMRSPTSRRAAGMASTQRTSPG